MSRPPASVNRVVVLLVGSVIVRCGLAAEAGRPVFGMAVALSEQGLFPWGSSSASATTCSDSSRTTAVTLAGGDR